MPSPIIGPDNTYEKQRKCRMQDAIDDYLNDGKYQADKHMKRCYLASMM